MWASVFFIVFGASHPTFIPAFVREAGKSSVPRALKCMGRRGIGAARKNLAFLSSSPSHWKKSKAWIKKRRTIWRGGNWLQGDFWSSYLTGGTNVIEEMATAKVPCQGHPLGSGRREIQILTIWFQNLFFQINFQKTEAVWEIFPLRCKSTLRISYSVHSALPPVPLLSSGIDAWDSYCSHIGLPHPSGNSLEQRHFWRRECGLAQEKHSHKSQMCQPWVVATARMVCCLLFGILTCQQVTIKPNN